MLTVRGASSLWDTYKLAKADLVEWLNIGDS